MIAKTHTKKHKLGALKADHLSLSSVRVIFIHNLPALKSGATPNLNMFPLESCGSVMLLSVLLSATQGDYF